MALTRLYEDIDGCLNASWNARAWRTEEDDPADPNVGYQRGWAHPVHADDGSRLSEYHTPPKYRMEFNERLIAALNTLDVEFVWATTWRQDAVAVGTLMGLLHDPQRVLHPMDGLTSFPSIAWKYEAIIDEQTGRPSPFIWVDDEINSLPRPAREVIHQLGGLMISPDFNFGITPEHIDQMRKYIQTHS